MIIKVPIYFEIEGYHQEDLKTLSKILSQLITERYRKEISLFNVRYKLLEEINSFKPPKGQTDVKILSELEVHESLRTKK
jgi:hypothetical protein